MLFIKAQYYLSSILLKKTYFIMKHLSLQEQKEKQELL